MGFKPLIVLFLVGLCLSPLGAMGGWEYEETPLGSPVDENTPRQRVYLTEDLETTRLDVVGPIDLQFKTGESKLVLSGTLGLLDQTRVEKTPQGWSVRLEPGLTRPPEGGRLTLEVWLPVLKKLTLRALAAGDLKIRQDQPLEVEVRDESRLTGEVNLPEIKGLFSWKSRGELTGAAGVETWVVRGESRLRVVDLKGSEARVSLSEGARLLISQRSILTGELRRKAQLLYAQGQDVSSLVLKEESSLELLP